jgi:multiple sugar transport system ATP-binding protein
VAGFIGSPPMNFVPATVEGNQLHMPFTSFELPAELRAAVGDRRQVMAGLRPERFEDLSLVDAAKAGDGVQFRTKVDVIEWLGNEQYAYVPYEVPEGADAGLHELERELDSERLRSQLVVALDPTSRIRDGAEAELWFDPRRMLLFDVASGDCLTLKLAQPA